MKPSDLKKVGAWRHQLIRSSHGRMTTPASRQAEVDRELPRSERVSTNESTR